MTTSKNNSGKNSSSKQQTSASAPSLSTPAQAEALKTSSTYSQGSAQSGSSPSKLPSNDPYKFTKTNASSKSAAKDEKRVWGNYARVRFNACDYCYSVDYKDASGRTRNTNGFKSLRDANAFARAVESFRSNNGPSKNATYSDAPKLKSLYRRWESYCDITYNPWA